MASVGTSLPRLPRRDSPARSTRLRGLVGLLCAVSGLLLMIAQVPFFVSIALTAPLSARIGLGVLWLVQFTLGVHWRSSRPMVPLLLAGVMTASWYLLGVVAAPHLGWTIDPLG